MGYEKRHGAEVWGMRRGMGYERSAESRKVNVLEMKNPHYHVRTEYTLAGFVAAITLLWQLTKREQMTPLKKSAHTVALTPTASHT